MAAHFIIDEKERDTVYEKKVTLWIKTTIIFKVEKSVLITIVPHTSVPLPYIS